MRRTFVLVALLVLVGLVGTVHAGAPVKSDTHLPNPYKGESSVVHAGRVYLLGGHEGGTSPGSRDIIRWYDPATQTLGVLQTKMPYPNRGLPVAWDGLGWVVPYGTYCAGGAGLSCYAFARLDLANDNITHLPVIPTVAQEGVVAFAWASGAGPCSAGCGYAFLESGEVVSYVPSTGAVTLVAEGGTFGGRQDAFVSGRNIYLFGGMDYTQTPQPYANAIWRFDAVTGDMTTIPAQLPCQCVVQVVPWGPKALLLGFGYLGVNAQDTVVEFNPATESVRILPWKLPRAYTQMGAGVVSESLILLGGMNSAEVSDGIWHRGLVNDPPSLQTWSSPATPQVGAPVYFQAAATDGDGAIANVTWTFDDGGLATGTHVSHAFASAGAHEVLAIATDNEGARTERTLTVQVSAPTSQSSSATTTTNPSNSDSPANSAPTAHASCIMDGLLASCSGLGSNDRDGDALEYAWDWGDGWSDEGTPVTHRYAAHGTYSVQLRVSDGHLQDDETVQVVAQAASSTQPSSSSATPTHASAPSPTSMSWSITLSADDEAQESPGFLASGVLLAIVSTAFAVRRKPRH